MKQSKLKIVPCTLRYANDFVVKLHRHHGSTAGGGGKFAIAVMDENKVVRGVLIAARPVSTGMDDGWTMEVARVCTDGCPNACSALYGAAWKISQALGFHRIITYTLPEEGGASLRGVGWNLVATTKARSWNTAKRFRIDKHPVCPKFRWEAKTVAYESIDYQNPTKEKDVDDEESGLWQFLESESE